MPIELLRELATLEMPAEVTAQDDVDKLRVLCVAGLVAAVLPPPIAPIDRPPKPAIVLLITPKGRSVLEGTLEVA